MNKYIFCVSNAKWKQLLILNLLQVKFYLFLKYNICTQIAGSSMSLSRFDVTGKDFVVSRNWGFSCFLCSLYCCCLLFPKET